MARGQGFAALSPEAKSAIARKGGQRAHENHTAHEWTVDEAREAGRKGGRLSRGGRGKLPVPAAQSPGPDPGPAAGPGPTGPGPTGPGGSVDG